jgi:hypothetical protein
MAKNTTTYTVEVFGLSKREAETLIREARFGEAPKLEIKDEYTHNYLERRGWL